MEENCIIDRAIVTDRTHVAKGSILKECFVNGHYFVTAKEEKPELKIVDSNWFVGAKKAEIMANEKVLTSNR